jgi:hypothetical protein
VTEPNRPNPDRIWKFEWDELVVLAFMAVIAAMIIYGFLHRPQLRDFYFIGLGFVNFVIYWTLRARGYRLRARHEHRTNVMLRWRNKEITDELRRRDAARNVPLPSRPQPLRERPRVYGGGPGTARQDFAQTQPIPRPGQDRR